MGYFKIAFFIAVQGVGSLLVMLLPQDECSLILTFLESPVAQPRKRRVLCPYGDGMIEVLIIQDKVMGSHVIYHYEVSIPSVVTYAAEAS